MKKSMIALVLAAAFWPSGSVAADSLNTTRVGRWDNPPYGSVDVEGLQAYYGNGYYLRILNISNPGYLVWQTGEIRFDDYIVDLQVEGGYAFVADGGLHIVDVTNPYRPEEIALIGDGDCRDVSVEGDIACLASRQYGLELYDVSTPSSPALLAVHGDAGGLENVAMGGAFAYATDGDGALYILDISTPSSPVQVSVLTSFEGLESSDLRSLFLAWPYLYLSDSINGLSIVDVGDPETPAVIGNFSGSFVDVVVDGDLAFASSIGNAMAVLDVSDPALPLEVEWHSGDPDWLPTRTGVAVQDGQVYLADQAGLSIFGVGASGALALAGFFESPGRTHAVLIAGNYIFLADALGLRAVLPGGSFAQPELLLDGVIGETVDLAAGSGGLYSLGREASDLCAYGIDGLGEPYILDCAGTGGEFGMSLAIDGSHAYVGDFGGLHIFDISDPSNLLKVGALAGMYVEDIACSNGVAYLAASGQGLLLVDVSEPTVPHIVGSYDTAGSGAGVAVEGPYAYLADGESGLRIFDVADPADPVEIGFFDTGGNASGVTVGGGFVYVADGGGGLRIIDAGDADSPVEVAYYDTRGFAESVFLIEDIAYVADGPCGLVIIRNDLATTSVPPREARRYRSKNYPNPFNPRTSISFRLPAAASVTLRIYDLSGRLTRSLLEGEIRGSGSHEVAWDGLDASGRSVAAGVYCYRIEAGGWSESRRMMLVK